MGSPAGEEARLKRPRQTRRGAGVALALVALAACAGFAPCAAASGYEAFYDQFSVLRPDSARVATVGDAGILVLEQGRLTLCAPVAGRVCAAVFEGRGVFSYTPPNPVERGQVERFYGTKALRRLFTSAVLVFGDSTLAELESGLTFGPGSPGGQARTLLRSTLRGLTWEKPRDVAEFIARPLLEGGPGDLFFAVLDSPGADPVAFGITPAWAEPVVLMRPAKDPGEGLLGPTRFAVVCQSGLAGDSTALAADTTALASYYERATIAIERCTVDATITARPAFSARASLEIESRVEGLRWIVLSLDDTLRVRGAEWGDGRVAAFHKGEGSPALWIECDPPLARGQRATLRVSYDGAAIVRERDGFRFRSVAAATGWYPWQDSERRAGFDLTFHVPAPLQFACVGERVASETRDGVTTSHWVTDTPIRRASFNLGFFKAYEVKDPRIPPVTVLMSNRGHRELTDSLAAEGEAPGRDMEKQVAADVANSLLFFEHRYGASGLRRFYATETNADHGEAFPGLIHLSTATFHIPNRSDALFRAQEVAHQWWGVGVGVATYHDQWLSEALAEFSALAYVQAAEGNDRRYFDQLEDWRKEILGNRKFILRPGVEAGPIWLGTRNETSDTRGDYGLIVYRKGAWVLHMLRNLMLDPDTMSEERFTALLHHFYQAWHGRDASTADFIALASERAGQDLGWFFDQWLYGTNTPSYRFAWKSARASDSTWVVHYRVEQRGVPESFRMPVLIRVDFAGDKFTRARVWVQGAKSEFDLPPVPLEPRKVTFNDMASVLGEVENVRW